MRSRPSPALIVAMLALFVALSGTATGLSGKKSIDHNDLRKHVVHTGKIHNGAVNSAKIRNGSVAAADLRDPEAFHVVGAQGEPAFANGGQGDCLWSNPSSAALPDVNPASFFKDADGIVHLAGVPTASDGPGGDRTCDTTDDLTIFRLPHTGPTISRSSQAGTRPSGSTSSPRRAG